MNFGSCLLMILAFGALSMKSATAGHRGHGSHSAAFHHHFRTGSRTFTPRDSGSESKGAVADHAKGDAIKDGSRLIGIDKRIGDDEHLHTRKSEGAGVSTPGHNASGKENATDDAIAPRIPAHHGRETAMSFKIYHLRSSNVAIAARSGFEHQHMSIRRGKATVRFSRTPRRNAVGATVDHDETGAHRNASGAATVPKATPGLETKSDSAQPATSAATHGANVEHLTGKIPADGPFSGTAQGNRRDAVAVTVGAMNGLSINGTGMIQPRSNMAVLGGAPKIATGVLSGNSFRPRHP